MRARGSRQHPLLLALWSSLWLLLCPGRVCEEDAITFPALEALRQDNKAAFFIYEAPFLDAEVRHCREPVLGSCDAEAGDTETFVAVRRRGDTETFVGIGPISLLRSAFVALASLFLNRP